MRRIALLVLVTALGCQSAQDAPALEKDVDEKQTAQDQKPDEVDERLNNSPRHSEWVEIQQGDRSVASFVAYPEAPDKRLALILIHENRGMADWLRAFADQVAEAGYVAIVPDLLSGMGPGGGNTDSFPDTAAATRAIGALPPDQVTADLKAVAAYIAKQPASSGKVAVAGFCWGGSQTFRFATNHADLVAACVFYGSGPTDPADIARIKAPVYGFYGGNDQRINGTIPQSEELMKAAGKFYEPVIYDGAGHAFMRQAAETDDLADPNKQAGIASWERLQAILAKHSK